jgi:2-iminobutanoate/2-iminopropanoate deaminase
MEPPYVTLTGTGFSDGREPICMHQITTDAAPDSLGPYSQAIRDGDTIYTSGQGPLDPDTGAVIDGDIAAQTAQTLANLEAVLQAGGSSLDDVVKTTVYVAEMADYDAVNEAYAEYLTEPYPARTAVEVGEFPVDIGVEIEVVARVG